MNEKQANIEEVLTNLSTYPDTMEGDLSIVLAAGHGKRIKSTTSKMLHQIWGRPTVIRVADATRHGLESDHQIIVVGIKAIDVATELGKAPNRMFAYQEPQHGTGHAVQVALKILPGSSHYGNVYIFPGDMGLLGADTIREFKLAFENSNCDMMVLTGIYKGECDENYYGRIIRVPETDRTGKLASAATGKVIEIKEHRDILALSPEEIYVSRYQNREYAFPRVRLVENREFNSGVFAFKAEKLIEYITRLSPDNVQGELYITDLISIFNEAGLSVGAVPVNNDRAVLGFNTKSVLAEMNEYARSEAYDKLKNIVMIEDERDFFVADDVIRQIIRLDARQPPIDISLGKGAILGPGVTVSRGLQLGRNASVNGRVVVGENCTIGAGVSILGDDGSPTSLGDRVSITGRSSVIGCTVDSDVVIEHCILEKRTIRKMLKDGKVVPVRFVMPSPEGPHERL